jgi:hypothetical protein
MKINISLSAIPLSLIRPFLKSWNKSRYASLFQKYDHDKNAYRIYLPLSGKASEKKIIIPKAILNEIQSQGYEIDSYTAGIARRVDNPKKVIKIGKLLKTPALKKEYDNDPQRTAIKNTKMWIVISRHPYDIAGMSFDRGWTSCMDLKDGVEKGHIKADIKYGTLVAYLINESDKNINAPIARILIKPYTNGKHVLLTPENTEHDDDKVYGSAPESFLDSVLGFCNDINKGLPKGKYVLANGLYVDATTESNYVYTYDLSDYSDSLPDEVKVSIISKHEAPENVLLDCMTSTDYRLREAAVFNKNATEKVLLLGAKTRASL